MSFINLREYAAKLESLGELKRITAEVDPYLEISEIADRLSKKNGPALLFENVKSSPYPLLINAFGSFRRMQLALNCSGFDEIAERLNALIKLQPPSGIKEKIKTLFTLKNIADIFPKKVNRAPCQERIVTDGEMLDSLPIIQCWPLDGGPYITLPIVISRDPETGTQNTGMYRMQKFDRITTGMHWQYNKDGARHYEKYKNIGKPMEVAVALGGPPAITYAATAPLPPDMDEMVFAGWLNSHAIEIVKAKTVDLYVPAQSDFVLEGYIEPGELRTEGPFGDHTGFYSAADLYPVFHITAITARQDAIYPATVVGKPPMEDCYMAKATERIFLPILKLLIPEMVDLNLPMEGVFHNCALVTIHKKQPGDGKKVIHALWGLGQMAPTKYIIVFDSDLDLNDGKTVLWKLMNNTDPKRDIIITEGPLDSLDHSAPFSKFGGKMGIDATRKTREEGMGRDWPEEIRMSDEIRDIVNKRWKEYGF